MHARRCGHLQAARANERYWIKTGTLKEFQADMAGVWMHVTGTQIPIAKGSLETAFSCELNATALDMLLPEVPILPTGATCIAEFRRTGLAVRLPKY